MQDKVTRCPQITTLEQSGQPKRNRTEVLQCQPNAFSAGPNRLTGIALPPKRRNLLRSSQLKATTAQGAQTGRHKWTGRVLKTATLIYSERFHRPNGPNGLSESGNSFHAGVKPSCRMGNKLFCLFVYRATVVRAVYGNSEREPLTLDPRVFSFKLPPAPFGRMTGIFFVLLR